MPVLAAAALAFASAPTAAQSIPQSELDERYDRALAAGYKALFMCGAIANAERNGTSRTAESVEEWELAGIQEPLASLIGDMPARIARGNDEDIDYVAVEWADDMPPRVAVQRPARGCAILPTGSPVPVEDVDLFERLRRDADYFDLEGENFLRDPLADVGFDAKYGADARTTAVVIVNDGELLSEAYASGFGPRVPQRTWSVAKSIAATIVGAAVQRGEARVEQSAGLGVSDVDPRRAITVDQALRMASGRYSDTPGNRTDPLYYGGTTVRERAANWPLLHRPRTVWRYANNDTLAAITGISDTFDSKPPGRVLREMGMNHTMPETDWAGDYVLSSQVWATARDLARLGQLHLNNGQLPDGTQVLPEEWTAYVSSPTGPQPDETQWGYGAGWWTMGAFEGIPADAFAARGNRGQYIVVVPSEDLVIVRRGEDPAGGSGFDIVQLTRDVIFELNDL
ncbi:serine hydrolase domain-containing protein [Aurantiacibacter aquimixticola]|nr:serine hydrolase [Aurantiacibacter aquimixticola]